MNKLILAEPPTESSHKSTTNPFMPAYIVEEVITDAVPDRSKNFQFPSIINPSSTNHITNNVPVPSYVVCPSEVLQKTTNFEADGSSRYNYGPNYYEKNRNQCKIYRFHRRFPSERYNCKTLI
ncbi:uncharacterized protein LOC131843627 [Achroia grisella]|uniref:uncharacterized protein LOC131843627 n=1 Tax=Achroia grisella TaxID=688607 RepID=UPI0027D23C7F|nr:uncharacterized protein LOC131843627 [Achroia grisella]